jgi:hypothetical protein
LLNKITFKTVLVVLGYIGLMAGGVVLGNWMFSSIRLDAQSASTVSIFWLLVPVFTVYFITSGLPFVPSSEIGFGLLIIFGGEIAPLIVLVSSAGLITSFLVGKYVPKRRLAELLAWFGLEKAPDFLIKLQGMNPQEKLDHMMQGVSKSFARSLMKYRYFGIMALLNIPGNAVIGGGGGIAFMAGVTGLFSAKWFAVSAILGVLPYPLFFFVAWLLGF